MCEIDNFIFTFRHKCNMNCNFCFIPFMDKENGNLNLWKKIIDFLLNYSPKLITFGGGDPFIAEDFFRLVKYVKENNLSVQVDTNGIALKRNMYKDVADYIDLLGLPLDGLGSIHDKIRNYRGHFDIVMEHLKKLSEFKCKIKINSVITSYNYKSLIELAKILNHFSLSCWSLHEFWWYENINNIDYKMDSQLVLHTVEMIRETSKNKVKFVRSSEVKNEHIFVSSIGNIFITDTENPNKYLELGNFQDSKIEYLIQKYIDCVAVSKRYRRKLSEEK